MRFRKAAGIDHQHRRSQLLATPLIHCSSQQLPSHPSTAALGCMGSGGAGGSLTSVLTYPPLFLADQRKILDPSFRAAVGSLYIQIYNVHMIVKTKWRPPGARRWRRLYRLSPPSPRSISGPRRDLHSAPVHCFTHAVSTGACSCSIGADSVYGAAEVSVCVCCVSAPTACMEQQMCPCVCARSVMQITCL